MSGFIGRTVSLLAVSSDERPELEIAGLPSFQLHWTKQARVRAKNDLAIFNAFIERNQAPQQGGGNNRAAIPNLPAIVPVPAYRLLTVWRK